MSSCLSGFSKNNQTGVHVCFVFCFDQALCPSTSRSVSLTHVALSSSSWPPRVTYSPTSNILKPPRGLFVISLLLFDYYYYYYYSWEKYNWISILSKVIYFLSDCFALPLSLSRSRVSLCLCLFFGKSFFAGKVAEEKNVVFLFLGLKETMLELIFQKKKKWSLWAILSTKSR